jgi:cbb3-type cytochrome oxidase subunit 3
MFGVISALVFSVATILSVGVIAFMLGRYRARMIAALLARPMPLPQAETRVTIERRRRPAPAAIAPDRGTARPATAALALAA